MPWSDGLAEWTEGDTAYLSIAFTWKATFASRGCPVGCWFCIVPKMEGKAFTLLPDFPVRPILCDNNLSALPVDYQRFVDRIASRTLRPWRWKFHG